MVAKIPLLTARPMLLSHIDDLLKTDRDFQFSYELYEEMVEAWIKREKGFVENSDELRDFSERLAVDLYLNRSRRGAERVPIDELSKLANGWGVQVSEGKLSGRSLLNRDADGNFKFAHRSIMEHLFVQRFWHNDAQCLSLDWTDQMKTFAWERILGLERFYSSARTESWEDGFHLPIHLFREPGLSVLAEIMSATLRTMGQVFFDSNLLTIRSVILTCNWILLAKNHTDVDVILLRCLDSIPGYTDHFVASRCRSFSSLVTGKAKYMKRLLEDENWVISADQPALFDECVFSVNDPLTDPLYMRQTSQQVIRSRKADLFYGEYLIIPLYLKADFPSFILVLSAKEHLHKNLLPIFSQIFAAFEKPKLDLPG
jgi:hypothetical protein